MKICWNHTLDEWGGFARGRNFIPGSSGGGRNNNVSVPVSEQTVQSHSTVVHQKFHSTGPLDWTRVGGSILEGEGVCICNVDILPRWEHPHFKPNCSRRQDTEYYLEDITGETISSQYLFSNIEGDRELVEGRGRSKLSGRVGEESGG